MKKAAPANETFDCALLLLEKKQLSREELRTQLISAGHLPPAVEEALGKTQALGYINDRLLAEALFSDGARRGKGPLWLEQKLRARGVEVKFVEHFVHLATTSALKNAGELLHREFPGDLLHRTQGRAYRKLISRGFAPELAEEAVAAALL